MTAKTEKARSKKTATTNNKQEENAMTTTAAATKENAYAGAADALGAGIDALFANPATQFAMVMLDLIEIQEQIREVFEDEENTLADLAASIKARGVIQPVLLRPTTTGYALVAGERRYRASKLAGLDQIPAFIREMTDDEAEDAQVAENIHRKNLSQIEEAKKIQRDLDRLGSVEAVLEKHHKSRPWLSKILSLLNLPEQAKRLVTENVSADLEVINAVKTIEKADPVKAQALVDDLKATRGKENARDKAAKVKDEVKPSKKPKADKDQKAGGGAVATPKDTTQEQPGPVKTFAPAKSGDSDKGGADVPRTTFSLAEALNNAYVNIFEMGANPKTVLDVMNADDKDRIEEWLNTFYDAGKQAKDAGRAVIQGFRNGQFSSDGDGAFALVAFLYGADSEAKFSLLNIFGSIKE